MLFNSEWPIVREEDVDPWTSILELPRARGGRTGNKSPECQANETLGENGSPRPGERRKRGSAPNVLVKGALRRILECGRHSGSCDRRTEPFQNDLGPVEKKTLESELATGQERAGKVEASPFFQSPLFQIPLAPAIRSQPSTRTLPANPKKYMLGANHPPW